MRDICRVAPQDHCVLRQKNFIHTIKQLFHQYLSVIASVAQNIGGIDTITVLSYG